MNDSLHSCEYWPTVDYSHGNMAMVVLLILTMLISIPGNLLIIITILNSTKLRGKVTYLFVFSVSLADFFVGTLAQPLYIGVVLTRGQNKLVCATSVIVAFISGGSSIAGIIGVTLDRYIYIMYPYKYNSLLTQRRCITMICLFWGTGIMFGIAHVFFYNRIMIQIAIFLLITISSLTAISANIRFLAMSLSKMKLDRTVGNKNKSQQQLQLTRLVVKISLAFGICWIPYSIIGLIVAADDRYTPASPVIAFWYWSVVLGYSNSALNVLLYGKKNTILSREVKRFLNIKDNAAVGNTISTGTTHTIDIDDEPTVGDEQNSNVFLTRRWSRRLSKRSLKLGKCRQNIVVSTLNMVANQKSEEIRV